MANIPEYTSQQGVSASQRGLSLIEPTERGSNAAANSGRTISALANAAGQDYAGLGAGLAKDVAGLAETYVTNKEVLKFTNEQADYMTAGILGWKKLAGSADITDPKVVAEYNQSLVKQDEAFLEGYTTKRGRELAMQEIRRRRDHLSQVQVSDVGIRTGEMAVDSVVGATNKFGALVQRDPTALEIALESIDQQTANLKSNPNLSEEQRAGFEKMGMLSKRNIAKTAFLTMAQTDPIQARTELNAGWQSKLLTPEDRDEMMKLTIAYEREAKRDANRAAVTARRQETDASNAAVMDAYSRHFNAGDGTWLDLQGFGRELKDIGTKYPTVAGPTVRAGLDMIERLTKEANGEPLPIADPDTAEDFRQRMTLAVDDPNRLTDEQVFNARAKGRLSQQEFNFYKEAVATLAKDPEKRDAYAQFNKFLLGMKSSITASNPLTGKVFPEQDRRFYDFSVAARGQFEAAYKTGNWRDLLNPAGQQFLGKQVSTYQLSNKEGLNTLKQQYNINAPVTGAEPAIPNENARKPGESMNDYLKRRGY